MHVLWACSLIVVLYHFYTLSLIFLRGRKVIDWWLNLILRQSLRLICLKWMHDFPQEIVHIISSWLIRLLIDHSPLDDVIKWKHFPRYWPFVRGIHRSPHKGQWSGALMFSLICVWINGWVNNCGAGDLRRNHAHYGVTVMINNGSHEFPFLHVYEGNNWNI